MKSIDLVLKLSPLFDGEKSIVLYHCALSVFMPHTHTHTRKSALYKRMSRGDTLKALVWLAAKILIYGTVESAYRNTFTLNDILDVLLNYRIQALFSAICNHVHSTLNG